MNEISLSDDLVEITAEINIWKQQAGQAVFEIGKRLKHVKENDLAHGQWESWLLSVDITPRTAQRMIQATEQFANTTTSSLFQTSKIFEMLSLPENVDRQVFIESAHNIPSIGETKTVDEMTVKQLREVTKKLKETESERIRLENESIYYRQQLNQERSKPSQVVTKEVKVEVVPNDYQDLKTQAAAGQKLNTENVKLQRTIQQMKEETTRADETSQLCKKLRESFKNILSTVNQEHYNAKFYFDQVAGSQQTFQIVQAFQQEFNEIINTVLLDWKDRTEIKPNLRSV